MLTKIDDTLKYGKQRGCSRIQILYPGLTFPELHDRGFGKVGRIDHARITPEEGSSIALPDAPDDDTSYLLYVFDGQLQVNHQLESTTGESVMIDSDKPSIQAVKTSNIILFMTQKNAIYYDDGMFSGNLY